MVVAWIIYGLIYLGFAAASEIWQIWLLFLSYGIYYGSTEGTGKAMIADLVAPARHGTAYGLFSAAVGIVALPASVLAGILWQGVGSWPGLGPSAPFVVGAILALMAAFLLSIIDLPAEQNSLASPTQSLPVPDNPGE